MEIDAEITLLDTNDGPSTKLPKIPENRCCSGLSVPHRTWFKLCRWVNRSVTETRVQLGLTLQREWSPKKSSVHILGFREGKMRRVKCKNETGCQKKMKETASE